MLKSVIILTALVAAGSAQAATVLFSDGFEADTPRLAETSALTNWTVTGNVDVVKSGTFGITCDGNCVDLDGTKGPGRITSAPVAFAAGQAVTISYDLSGSQRSAASDDFYFFVSFPFPYISATDISWSQPGAQIGSAPAFNEWSGQLFSADIAGNMPWTTFTFSFTPTSASTLQIGFFTTSADNVGPLVDNVLVTQALGAVPEPATWAMLIAGFGMVGFTMRRRRLIAA